MRLLALVLPLAPLPLDAPFPRREWPAHLTVLSNFLSDGTDEDVARVVQPVLARTGPVHGRVGEQAWFGLAYDVRVRLVDSAEAHVLHGALLDAIRPAGFEHPTHQGAGYRPHVSVTPTPPLHEGADLVLPEIALAAMDGAHARIRWAQRLGGHVDAA
ncbi:hypothetical protein GCM10025783_32900 [Amnibacterium soli]|uniref:2'-5' RNA ligase family protein n=1 Tax=Amnibacterium soli TaxID=1282736 RepID=A0ABP8ZI71_9MICO